MEKREQSAILIQNKFRRYTKKKELFYFAKKNKYNYSIYPSFLSDNNKKNIKIKLYNDLLKSDYYVLPVKFCNIRNCYVFDIPKNQFNDKSNKIIHFNFISNNNKVIVDPKYTAILFGDNYVNQIDLKTLDKKDNMSKKSFKFSLNRNEDYESDSSSIYKDNDSEKEETIEINYLSNNIINLSKSNSSKLDIECLLSNTFSTSTKDSIHAGSPIIKKIKRKRAKSILKNKEGISRSNTKKRDNKSTVKRVSFGSSQISFYKAQIK